MNFAKSNFLWLSKEGGAMIREGAIFGGNTVHCIEHGQCLLIKLL